MFHRERHFNIIVDSDNRPDMMIVDKIIDLPSHIRTTVMNPFLTFRTLNRITTNMLNTDTTRIHFRNTTFLPK